MQNDKKQAFVSANTKAEEMHNASLTKCIVAQNIWRNKRKQDGEVVQYGRLQRL